MDNQQYGNDGADYQLSDLDKAAVDALFDGSDSGADTERFDRVSLLLGLLDTPVADEDERDARIDVTELRVHSGGELVLGAASASSVDDWMHNEESMTDRDETHDRMTALMTGGASYTQAERDSLVERTLDLIQSEIDRSEKRYIMDLPFSPKGRFRLADLVTPAASLLLIASVAIPVLGGMRSRSMQAQCLDNMASAVQAFGMYTGSNRDSLPMATAGFGSTLPIPWPAICSARRMTLASSGNW